MSAYALTLLLGAAAVRAEPAPEHGAPAVSLQGDVMAVGVREPPTSPPPAEPADLPARPPGERSCRRKPPAAGLPPPGAMALVGDRKQYEPLLHFPFGEKCLLVEGRVDAALTVDGRSSVELDRYGNRLDPRAAYGPRLRVGLRFDSGAELAPLNLAAQYEHDLLTGFAGADIPWGGQGYPRDDGLHQELRQAFVRAAAGTIAQLTAGWNTSHWGMGLLANDGDHGWEPGSARFADPRGGDRMLRFALSTGPHPRAGLVALAGGDVLDPDLLSDDDVLLGGDHGHQVVAALLAGAGQPWAVGVYAVSRHQEAPDGSPTDVWAVDLTGRTTIAARGLRLGLETEAALVTGTTELAPSVEHPEHAVLQLGWAARANLDLGWFGTALDFLYASGDQNLDDAAHNAFKTDPNYELGLLLFSQVLAAQSARAAFTAGDPSLVGVPAEDLDRVPTRQSASNTVALFPRLRVRPLAGLEAYGGPLFAFAVVPPVDPLSTRLAGGEVRNALGGDPGRYLGTELDLGVRYRVSLGGSDVTLGAECGALRPGSALRRTDGTEMPAVYGGRLMIGGRL
ncbi:MAG: hypothetical protein HY744_25255 [Deltaproteobacteria bacterium]|nr:hypothetical protein [Deltaproteobacteria bacterium]